MQHLELPASPTAPSLRIVLAYATVAAICLFLSDQLIDRSVGPGSLRNLLLFVDVLLFVGISTAVLFQVWQRRFSSQVRASVILREVLARVGDAFVSLDRDGTCVYVNRRAALLLGRVRPDELLGSTVWSAAPMAVVGAGESTMAGLFGPVLRGAFEQALATQRPVTVENDSALRGRWFESRLYPSPNGVSIYVTDITDRKQAERALIDAEAYRRNVFDQLGDGVFLIDRDHRFTDVNARALVMLGRDHAELLAMKAGDVMPGFERERIVREMAQGGAGQPYFERRVLRRRDGTDLPVEVSARFLDDRHIVFVVRDISRRVKSEQALRDYRDELTELTQRLISQERATLQRIAQSLHDHVGQTLGAARLTFDAYAVAGGIHDTEPAHVQRQRVALLLDQAVAEVRQVLADLRPPLLSQQGLAAALAMEIDSLVVVSRRVDVLLETEDRIARLRWPADVEFSAFMVAREAIANAQQHANASLVRVLLDGTEQMLSLQVIDDGDGIAAPMLQGRAGHLGIVGMRERTLAVGGHFEIGRDGLAGTRVGFRWERPVA